MKYFFLILSILFLKTSYSQTFITYYPPSNQNLIYNKNTELIGYCKYNYSQERNDFYSTDFILMYSIQSNRQQERFEIFDERNRLVGFTVYNNNSQSIDFYNYNNHYIGYLKMSETDGRPTFIIFNTNNILLTYCVLIGETSLDSSRDFSSAILLSFINLSLIES